MKAVSAASIGDYERAVNALGDYYSTVERGLGVCFRDAELRPVVTAQPTFHTPHCVIVFGTDQGLVGQFNETIADFALTSLASLAARPVASPVSPQSHPQLNPTPQQPLVWVVGERLNERLNDAKIVTQDHYDVPSSVKAITTLIGRILLGIESLHPLSVSTELHLFYHRPGSNPIYSPIHQRLLPLDKTWSEQLTSRSWPTSCLPQPLGNKTATLRALIREYLFVSLFRASAESLSSENASRLAAMQRADKNIEELLATLNRNYHRLRQSSIDAEMFDIIAGSKP